MLYGSRGMWLNTTTSFFRSSCHYCQCQLTNCRSTVHSMIFQLKPRSIAKEESNRRRAKNSKREKTDDQISVLTKTSSTKSSICGIHWRCQNSGPLDAILLGSTLEWLSLQITTIGIDLIWYYDVLTSNIRWSGWWVGDVWTNVVRSWAGLS